MNVRVRISRRTRVMCVVALLAGSSVTACGDDDDDGGGAVDEITSIAEALERDGDARLEGFVVAVDDRARLCSVLMESFPPQCGEPSIEIVEIAPLDVELASSQGVSWSDAPVSVEGSVTDGVLTIDG